MPIFSDPRLDPVDINSSSEYFPKVTTPEVMALHMTRHWKAVTPSTDEKTLDAIYVMWLEAYRQLSAWHDAHPDASPEEAKSASEDVFARVCRDHGIPSRAGGAPRPSAGAEPVSAGRS